MGKYTAAMKAVNPWDTPVEEDKYVDSEFWKYISDPVLNSKLKDLWSIRYAKKGNLMFKGNKVETNFQRFKLFLFVAIHEFEEMRIIMDEICKTGPNWILSTYKLLNEPYMNYKDKNLVLKMCNSLK
jgi:hypothetical protein